MKPIMLFSISLVIKIISIITTWDIDANNIIETDKYLIVHSEVNPIISLAIVTALLGIVITYFYRRINYNSSHELEDLKHNISLLRDEKLGSYLNIKLQSKRRKILDTAEFNYEDLNLIYTQKAKKLGVSTGDFLLASKIQMINKKD